MVITLVYAKCDANERLFLWDSIYLLANTITLPWLVGGDFSIVWNEEEKNGGLPVYPQEYGDFAFSVDSCELEVVR